MSRNTFSFSKKGARLFYIATYILVFVSLMFWNGLVTILISLYALGAPLLVFGIPFYSILMLTKTTIKVKIGYLCSLTAAIYLFEALTTYPIRLYPIVDGTTLPLWKHIFIVLSLVCFLASSTILYRVRMNELRTSNNDTNLD